MQGQLDLITPEGVAEGWCWNERSPNERVTVVIRVDGAEAGRTIASHYREDLRRAGIGDGCHFFRCVLPDDVLGRNRAQVVTLFDATSGERIGNPYTVRSDRAMTFDERLTTLEARNRLLESRLAEVAQARSGDSGQAELFAVVGAFFERLSQDVARGITPTAEQQLSEAIRAVTRAYPRLAFPAVEVPAVAILVEAAYPLANLHACLAAVRQADADLGVRVTVLDTGAVDETALLPSFARGIRYVRTAADLVAEWIEAARSEATPILLFLSGGAVVDPAFLEQIAGRFDAHPGAGAIGGCIVDPDRLVRRGGMRLIEGRLEDVAEATPAASSADAESVHALTRHAVAFRRAAIEAVGGLDIVFGDDLDAAVIDLCFRLRQAGWSVDFHPCAIALFAGLSEACVAAGRSRTWDLLEQRWLTTPNDDCLPLNVGF